MSDLFLDQIHALRRLAEEAEDALERLALILRITELEDQVARHRAEHGASDSEEAIC